MTPGTEHRKLAAIMFTDMVGYSALAQRSEALALELLEEQRRLLRGLLPRFNGTEIKTIGDAFLVEFGSALEAAQCAIEIQRTLAHRNTDVPAEKRIQVRIGIHIGDVVHREGDVYGDGVNIASRIEQLAGPSGICISMDVERQIRHALEASLVKLPAAALKNIHVPMELFRIVLPWEKAHDEVQSPESKVQSRQRVLTSAGKRSRWTTVLVALAVIVVVGVGRWLTRPHGATPGPTKPAALTNLTDAAQKKSVAVLPFVNMSPDKADEYLSDGISEEMITALSKITGLQVKARTSSFAFKGKNEDIQRIGERLHVSHLLDGSVAKAGNKLRITVQLIKVSDGNHLWSDTYDRDMQDIFAVRSEVAQQVAAVLRVQLLPGEKQQLEKKGTKNPEALRLYLLGRSFWNQRTKEVLQKALDYFEQALVKDPNYALAHVGMADCYLVLPEYAGVPTKEALPKAQAAALAALKLDNTLGEAHAALALGKMYEYDWQGAEAEFKRAVELSPNYATARHWYSNLLRCLGRLDEADREIQRAQELDPLSPVINRMVGVMAYYQGHYDEAIAVFRTLLELNPNFRPAHDGLGTAYLLKQMYSEAITEFKAIEDSGYLGLAYGLSGRVDEARKVLDELTRSLLQGRRVQYDIALVYLGLGDREKALEWLEKALEAQEPAMIYLKPSLVWKNLRSEPRFVALLKKMGLEK